ncbi:unnamed protein product [Closterium sp. NIES-64]|nr:unnamed protein product [Closterium sp. NIES-64]
MPTFQGIGEVSHAYSTKPAVSKAQSGQSANGKNRMVVKAMAPNALVDINAADEVKFKALVSRRVVFDHSRLEETQIERPLLQALAHHPDLQGHRRAGPPVSVMTGIAAAVVGWNEMVVMGILPEWAPVLHISNLPFSLTAPALSFLLVFRTNASYGRFDEARKMWGLMLNRTRDITRQALSYMARDQYTYEYPKRAQFIRHLQAFPLTYKHHFIQEGSLEEDLRDLTSLTDAEIAGVLGATHRPNYVLQMMSECMRSCTMEPVNRLAMVMLIENPFPILALVVISQSARNNAGELVALHEGIRNLVAEDDLEMKNLSARKQEALLQTPQFVAEPEPEYMSDWDEDAAALTPIPPPPPPAVTPIAVRGPYSD